MPTPGTYSALDADIATELRSIQRSGGTAAPGEDGARRMPRGELRTLEDLYEQYSGIGSGAYCLRIVRREPKAWGGIRITGYISPDLWERMSMEAFASRYGGGTYEVSVLGPSPRKSDSGGGGGLVTLRTIRIEVPGNPKMYGTGTEEDMATTRDEHPTVQVERMKFDTDLIKAERARSDRMQEQLLSGGNNSKLDASIFDVLERHAQGRAQQVREQAQDSISVIKDENQRLREELQSANQLCQQLRTENQRVVTDAANKMQFEETRRISELREQHRDEISKVSLEHSRALEKMSEDYRKMLTEATGRHMEERRQAEAAAQHDRDRAREEHERREKSIKESFESREKEMIRSHEREMDQLVRSHERELKNITDQSAREILTIRTVEENNQKTSEATTKITMESLKQELERERGEVRSLRAEAERLKREIYKPLPEQIAYAHQVAGMTGMVLASEAGGGGEDDGEFDWKKSAFGIVKELVGKAPEIARGVEETRAKNRAMAEQMAAEQQMHQQHGGRPRGPMRRQPLPMPGLPPAWGEGGPGDPTANPMLPPADGPIMAAPPPPPRKPPPLGASNAVDIPRRSPPPGAGREPTGETMATVPPFGAPQPTPAQQQAPQAPPPPPPSPAAPPPPQIEFTEQHFAQLVTALDNAIGSEMVTAEQFAAGFIQEIGRERAHAIIRQFRPEHLINAVEQSPGGANTAIVTRNGRMFLAELWQRIAAS